MGSCQQCTELHLAFDYQLTICLVKTDPIELFSLTNSNTAHIAKLLLQVHPYHCEFVSQWASRGNAELMHDLQ